MRAADARSGSDRTCRREGRASAACVSSLSEPRSMRGKKLDFLGRRRATEDRVTVRESTKSANQLGVLFRKRERIGETGLVAQPAEELHRALLRGSRFGMLKRHVQEPSLDRNQRAIRASRDGLLGDRKRLRVAGESARRIAKAVARELIEQDDARESAPRRRPVFESAGEGGLDHRAESGPQLRVERRVLAEPEISRPPELCRTGAAE